VAVFDFSHEFNLQKNADLMGYQHHIFLIGISWGYMTHHGDLGPRQPWEFAGCADCPWEDHPDRGCGIRINLTYLKNMKVSWDYDIPNCMEK
jgi:hypothetical protein